MPRRRLVVCLLLPVLRALWPCAVPGQVRGARPLDQASTERLGVDGQHNSGSGGIASDVVVGAITLHLAPAFDCRHTGQHFPQKVPATYIGTCVSILVSRQLGQGAGGRMERKHPACLLVGFMVSALLPCKLLILR